MMSTFCLATADDPPPGRFAAGLGHHGTLAFSFVVLVEKDDDPVGLPAKLVRPRGVRVERSEMSVAAHGVEQR